MNHCSCAPFEAILFAKFHKMLMSILQREGIAVTSGCNRPKLVNLAENPQLSEMLEYELREGVSQIGRWREDAIHEIQLRGPLIADDHW
jgi:hypothetical protein